MELLNAEVIHKSFGNGVITKVEDIYIYVLFTNNEFGEKKFLYPDIFKVYLTTGDAAVDEKVKLDLHEKEENFKKKAITQEPVSQQQNSKTPDRVITNRATNINHSHDNVAIIDDIKERCIIIKINQNGINNFNGDIYETTRQHWRISLDRARDADYVLSVHNQVVIEVFTNMVWSRSDENRIHFVGDLADDNIRTKYIGKRIPQRYREHGNASPCQYVNC